MQTVIVLLATFIAALIIAQTVWILKLYAQIEKMERTWRPRNTGVLSPMPLSLAAKAASTAAAKDISAALVGEVVTEDDVMPTEQPERQFRVAWNVEVEP